MSLPAAETELVHATALALGGKAALIRGPSGAGKSDLALRCIALPPFAHVQARVALVADDQVRLMREGDTLAVSPPPTIAGKMEVRGLGILTLPYESRARVALVVDLVPPAEVPRFPLDRPSAEYLGIAVPILRLSAFESSAPVKLVLALEAAAGTLTPP